MKKFKVSFVVLIIFFISLTFINFFVRAEEIRKVEFVDSVNESTLLSSIPEEGIFLYALDSDEGKGLYEEILLDIKGKQRFFYWAVDSGLSFRPQLILSDINSDGKKELVVIITKWHGTWMNAQEVHVFQVDTFNEIPVEDVQEIIDKNVKSKVNKEEDRVQIIVSLNGKETKVDGDKINLIYNESLFKKDWDYELFWENMIGYELVDGKLRAIVGGQLPNLLVGNVIIEYKFKDNMLVMDKIDFVVMEAFKE